MEKIIEALHAEYGGEGNTLCAERNRIIQSRNALKKSLTKYERRLLLRIIDDHDLIVEKTSFDSFSNGVIVGARVMLEILYR